MMMKIFLFQIKVAAAAILLSALCLPAAGAESPFKVTLSTDRSSVVSGGNVNVTLTFSHTDLAGDGIRLPEISGASWRTDRVSRSSSTRIINGVREENTGYSLPLTVSAPAGSTIQIPAVTFKRRAGIQHLDRHR